MAKMTEKSKLARNSGKMGRPEFVPRLDDHEKVQVLRASGMSLVAIAVALDVHPETLTKHFAFDLEIAVAKRTAAVMVARYRAAIGGNIAAQTKFLKLAGAIPPKPKRRAKAPQLGKKAQAMSADPLDVDLARPNTWLQPTTAREPDGKEVDLPRFEWHMLCDEDGRFPENFNSWEDKVLLAELQREGTIAWYRNPARASQDSLGIIYEDGGESRIVRPDFIFFAQMPDGSIAADIIDPHGHYLADAIPKLKGLAKYAEANAETFRRIEAVTKTAGGYRVLDLTEPSVRTTIHAAQNAQSLFEGPVGADYIA